MERTAKLESTVHDTRGRPFRSLRLSVTDRCNLRCQYCMPEESYAWLPRRELLSFEEMDRLVRIISLLGVDKVRLTGGEPLLRRDLDGLIAMLAQIPEIKDLALTTNGIFLADQAKTLRAAGLDRITVSLDTLRRDRFIEQTGRDRLAQVLAGIDAAQAAGFGKIRTNTVVVRGTNDDELSALISIGRERNLEIRFIEYMDVGGATQWQPDRVVSQEEILASIEREHGPVEAVQPTVGTARRYRLQDGTIFGIIASTTAPFCGACDRGRITADGLFLPCLYAHQGLDLREPLRSGATDQALREVLVQRWGARDHQGAKDRFMLLDRGPLLGSSALREDPRLEMHTRGG